MKITDMVLVTTRPRRNGEAFTRDVLVKWAEDLNAGTATAHPLEVASARVNDDEDGHASLLISGEWPDGVRR